jgi:U3 small nucleolar RNA-associated protein 23
MITTCDMRHLYNAKPKNETLILQAKEYERRRCNHQDLEDPLSTLECLSSVVDPKDNHTNKHRYVVASNDSSVRARMRSIAGVPLIYISKSVVLMEPMANASEEIREREEKSKFKQGLKGQRKSDAGQKRKRDDEGEGQDVVADEAAADAKKRKRQKGPKGPNPLSVKKAKKDTESHSVGKVRSAAASEATDPISAAGDGAENTGGRKRKRKPKSKTEGSGPADNDAGEADSA